MTKLVIHSSYFAEPVAKPLLYCLKSISIALDLQFEPPTNAIHTFAAYNPPREHPRDDTMHIVLLTPAELGPGNVQACATSSDSGLSAEFVAALDSFSARIGSACLIGLCPVAQASNKGPAESLRSAYRHDTRLTVCDLAEVFDAYDVLHPYSSALEASRLCPYTKEAYAAIALGLARGIASRHLPRRKVLALDCDGTLWHGECGEKMNLSIDVCHTALQQLVIRQQEAGALLAIVSRNDLIDVSRAFRSLDGMLIKPEDIAVWKVNWNRKSENLLAIANELRIAPEDILFLDNDEFECAEVRANCGVPALCVPEPPRQRERILKLCWLLDTVPATSEDRMRNSWASVARVRERALSQSRSVEDFLEYAALSISIRPATLDDAQRVAQLTQRTNQFNSTGRRWTAYEIEAGIAKPMWVASAADRFGPYGLIAAAIGGFENDVFVVHSFVVSCRALKRHVEDSLLAVMCRAAEAKGLRNIKIQRRTTGKNNRFEDFCRRLVTVTHAVLSEDALFCDAELVRRAARETSFGCMLGVYTEDTIGDPAGIMTSTPNVRHDSPSPVLGYLLAVQPIQSASQLVALLDCREREVGSPEEVTSAVSVGLKIESLWKRLLNVTPIGADDEFFALGGDSLQALEMIYELNEIFHVEIELSLLFEPRFTIGRLVEAIACEHPTRSGK